MTTNTTETSPVIPLPATAARALTILGALITITSAFLAWTWTSEFPGDLTVYGYPADLQMLTIVGGALTLLLAATGYGIRGLGWLNPSGSNNPTVIAAFGALATTLFTLIAITVELGGLANLEPGGYVAAAGVILAFTGALGLPLHRKPVEDLPRWNWFLAVIVGVGAYALYRHVRLGRREGKLPKPRTIPAWAEILIIAATFAIGLFAVTYGIDTDDKEPQLFFAYLLIVAFAAATLSTSGLVERLSAIIGKHRQVTLIGSAAAAIAFPFIQQSGDTYTLIAVNILIFATVALGLNVVVGLAGLLDLGYVAFLGVGAYAAALVSGSTASAFGFQLPFWAAVIVGALASLIFGVIIGAPTLRLRGDYL
ncbi:ABC transporter permease subunit, partial [Streptomyces goshikiensis]